jgi:anti-sigma-K factor RskA
MICLSENEQGADLLAGYLAKTLDADGMAEMDRHIRECADCRGLVSVWERLDEFAAPEVTAGFDARLYARIAAEGAKRLGWRRLWRNGLLRPVAPLAVAAAAVAALVLYLQPVRTPDASKQTNKSEIEQVAQAVDDLDLLTPIDR